MQRYVLSRLLAVSLAVAGSTAAHAQVIPRLVCSGGPATGTADVLTFDGSASCSVNSKQFNSVPSSVRGWTANPQEIGKTAHCPHSDLDANGDVGISRACVGLPNGGVHVWIGLRARARAGYEPRTREALHRRVRELELR